MKKSYRQQYVENKQKITDCLDEAIAFMDELGYSDRKNALQKQKEDLETGEFTIVVVGEFSAGKSTFLNALMGKKLLPSFTSETTATINFLRHKDCAKNGEEGCVYFSDGSSKSIPVADEETISKYVSTRGENVAETVHHLDLYKESKFLENNVTLVDSPGLNGVASGHAEMTKDQIRKSSASIFMFSARQPGSKTDFEVLAELSKSVSSIICVLNQIDAIKTNEGETVESVIQKLKSNYKEVMGDSVTSIPEIYPVSARQALLGRDDSMTYNDDLGNEKTLTSEQRSEIIKKSRIEEFEDRLFKYLTQGEKAKASLESPIKQLENIICEVSDELNEEKQILEGKFDKGDLEHQIEELEDKKEKLEGEIHSKKVEITGLLDENKKEIIDKIKSDAERLKTRLIHRMDTWEDVEDIDPENIRKRLEVGVKTIADDAENEFRDSNTTIIRTYTDDVINETFGEGFTFKISGDLQTIEPKSLGYEQHRLAVEELEKELKELKTQNESISEDFFAKMEAEEKRNNLEKEISAKKNERDLYEQSTLATIPSVRTYTVQEEREHIIKKRKIFADKVEYVMVDVVKTDDSERREYIERRDGILKKREEDIANLEEELRSIPVGNTRAIANKQKEIEASIEAKNAQKDELKKEFRAKAEKEIKTTIKNNKRMVEDFIDENIERVKSGFSKQYVAMESALIDTISEKIASSVIQRIEATESKIKKFKDEIDRAETAKNAQLEKISSDLTRTQGLIDKAADLHMLIDAIPENSIESIELED